MNRQGQGKHRTAFCVSHGLTGFPPRGGAGPAALPTSGGRTSLLLGVPAPCHEAVLAWDLSHLSVDSCASDLAGAAAGEGGGAQITPFPQVGLLEWLKLLLLAPCSLEQSSREAKQGFWPKRPDTK